jgi:hypothetical protein
MFRSFRTLNKFKFVGEFHLGAMTLEFREIERQGIADLPTPELGVPSRRREHFRGELDVERWPRHQGVARESRQGRAVIVAEIPEFAADQDVRRQPNRERRAAAKGGFSHGFIGCRPW